MNVRQNAGRSAAGGSLGQSGPLHELPVCAQEAVSSAAVVVGLPGVASGVSLEPVVEAAPPATGAPSSTESDEIACDAPVGGPVDKDVDKTVAVAADGALAMDMPTKAEAARATGGMRDASDEEEEGARTLSFCGMPIPHWRMAPTFRQWVAYQLSLPRSERCYDSDMSPLRTPSDQSEPQDGSE